MQFGVSSFKCYAQLLSIGMLVYYFKFVFNNTKNEILYSVLGKFMGFPYKHKNRDNKSWREGDNYIGCTMHGQTNYVRSLCK